MRRVLMGSVPGWRGWALMLGLLMVAGLVAACASSSGSGSLPALDVCRNSFSGGIARDCL